MLTRDSSITSQFLVSLKEMMRSRRLLYGEREIGAALRPHFLTRTQYKLLSRTSEVLARVFEKIAAALLAEPWRMKTIGLTEREVNLALVDPKYSATAVTSRLDAFVYGHEIKVVEYNAENPSSLTDQTGLNEILSEVAAMRTTAEYYRLRQFSPVESLLKALLRTFHEWGGIGVPNVAILDWEGLPTAEEFVLLQEFFTAHCIPTVICNPSQLEYESGKLRCGKFTIDLVYKRVIINELLARCDDSHPLIRAYVHGDVCVVNSFRCKLAHKKAVFELLTDETSANWLTAAEKQVVKRAIPWTRRIVQRKTRHRGQSIDLVEYVRQNPVEFVVKPNDDYGGRGVTIGKHSTQTEWDEALSEALNGDYVVQEALNLRTEVFPIFNSSGWTLQPMYVDTNPFLFDGRVEGALVRLSDSPVVNVTSGGGETGFFVVDGKILP